METVSLSETCHDILGKVKQAIRSGSVIKQHKAKDTYTIALKKQIITHKEFDQLMRLESLRMEIIAVDSFDTKLKKVIKQEDYV